MNSEFKPVGNYYSTVRLERLKRRLEFFFPLSYQIINILEEEDEQKVFSQKLLRVICLEEKSSEEWLINARKRFIQQDFNYLSYVYFTAALFIRKNTNSKVFKESLLTPQTGSSITTLWMMGNEFQVFLPAPATTAVVNYVNFILLKAFEDDISGLVAQLSCAYVFCLIFIKLKSAEKQGRNKYIKDNKFESWIKIFFLNISNKEYLLYLMEKIEFLANEEKDKFALDSQRENFKKCFSYEIAFLDSISKM